MEGSQAYKESPQNRLEQAVNRPVPLHARPWIWLATAAALLLFSNGAYNIPPAAWLAPVFLLRFVRMQSPKVGLPIAYALLAAAFAIQFRGMVPIPGVGYYIFLVLWGIPLVSPYIVDQLLVRRLTGFTASLVFPTAWAATEYLVASGPYGSWGSAAYSQYGNLPLLQLLSLTGLWGITFLIGWFAAGCNWIWEEGLDSRSARRGAWLCFGTITIVMLLGGARLALFPPSSRTVRVASISRRDVAGSVNLIWPLLIFSFGPTPWSITSRTQVGAMPCGARRATRLGRRADLGAGEFLIHRGGFAHFRGAISRQHRLGTTIANSVDP